MGNLFTRALRRLTQSSGTNQLPSHEQQETSASQQQRERSARPIVQSIPVGQSIDSAEYAAFDSAKSSQSGLAESRPASETQESSSRRAASVKATIEEEDEEEKELEKENCAGQENALNSLKDEDEDEDEEEQKLEQGKPEVEEAVIKIQAFVRGHLTRKALKDAQQQAATPAPNALGQSQFDQESLMKSQPSAVFAMSAAPADLHGDQINRLAGGSSSSRVAPLESIAEDVEQLVGEQGQGQRRKLSPMSRSLAISAAAEGSNRSEPVSPAASEANASIELRCQTPASASIDILDHNIRPADAIASVLHPKQSPSGSLAAAQTAAAAADRASGSPRMVIEPPTQSLRQTASASDENNTNNNNNGFQQRRQQQVADRLHNSHSMDSAEAAAIRIQSAYRGYHTRKHSPYRRRSPGSGGGDNGLEPAGQLSLDGSLSNGQAVARRSPLRQQNASVALDELIDEQLAVAGQAADEHHQRLAEERLQEAAGEGSSEPPQRTSRRRHRLDTDDSQKSDSPSAPTHGPALAGTTTSTNTNTTTTNSTTISTLDEPSTNETCLSALALEIDPTAEGALTDANLHSAAEPPEAAKVSPIEQNLSLELDTESSNLGAALSMNEDLSERDSVALASSVREQQPSPDERASEVQRFVDQLVNDEEEELDTEETREQERALDRATSQLVAALEQATEEEGGAALGESLAGAISDAQQEQQTNELESDDIERRDPRGQCSQEQPSSPAISTAEDSQPALASAGSSFEDEGQQGQQQQRLGVESPDEAIGSGRSSPALVSSNAGSSSEGEDEDELVEETKASDKQAAQQTGGQPAQGSASNRNKKKNRNRRKGRK